MLPLPGFTVISPPPPDTPPPPHTLKMPSVQPKRAQMRESSFQFSFKGSSISSSPTPANKIPLGSQLHLLLYVYSEVSQQVIRLLKRSFKLFLQWQLTRCRKKNQTCIFWFDFWLACPAFYPLSSHDEAFSSSALKSIPYLAHLMGGNPRGKG